MNDIWSIIGLSSLVASVVAVILGIVRDVLVEKYRFKRQSEAEYIQKQINVHSRLNFFLHMAKWDMTQMFGTTEEIVKELNAIIKENFDLLDSRILNKWLDLMALCEYAREKEDNKLEEEIAQGIKMSQELRSLIKEIMNDNLIPKYRKIVGETVPTLE